MVEPDVFTCGATGEPGRRVFYFQAVDGDVRVEVKCEKQQAVALAEHLTRLLGDLPEPPGGDDETFVTEAVEPMDMAFVVGSISIGVDRTRPFYARGYATRTVRVPGRRDFVGQAAQLVHRVIEFG